MLRIFLVLILTLVISACLFQPDSQLTVKSTNSVRLEIQHAIFDTKNFYNNKIVILEKLLNNKRKNNSLKLIRQQQLINDYVDKAKNFIFSINNIISISPNLQQDNGLLQERQVLVSYLDRLDKLAQSISHDGNDVFPHLATIPCILLGS